MLKESLEAKQYAAKDLAELLNVYSREKVTEIIVTEDTATINYDGGGQRVAGIGCDSVTAMILDICKEILR